MLALVAILGATCWLLEADPGYLDALIKGQHPLSEVYKMRSDGPDGSKADIIRTTVLDYRAHARRQLLDE